MKLYYKSIAIIVLIVFSILVIYIKDLYLSSYVNIATQSSKYSSIQVYYDNGNGFDEQNSEVIQPINGKLKEKLYSFKLPNKYINSIRIDPSSDISDIEIKYIEVDNRISKKKYIPNDLKKNIISTNQIFIDANFVGYITGNDPQIVFNDFICKDFKIPFLIKFIILSIIYIIFYVLILLTRTNKYKKYLSSVIQYIKGSKFVTSLNLNNRFDLFIYGFLYLVIFLSLAHTILISLTSIIYGFIFTLIALLLSFVSWMTLILLPNHNLSNIIQKPFHNLFVGQLLFFVYIYIRSAFNEYIYYLPLSFIEIIAIVIILILIVRKRLCRDDILSSLHKNKNTLMLSFGLFFLIIVGISENELPRIFMLSTDPDQHAFFAKQIERFGMIPYSQFFWGTESFNYPSGSGVLGYIWSALGFIDVRNSIHILPLLQAVIAIFIVIETIITKIFNPKKFIYISLGLFLTFVLFLRYTFEPNHFYQEGTGRLMSISISAFIISLLVSSYTNRENTNSTLSSLALIVFIAMMIFYSATLNPINVFYVTALLIMAFIVYLSQNIKYYLFVPIIFVIFFILILLDPYYLNVFIYKSHNNIVHTIHYKSFDLTINVFLKMVFLEIKTKLLHLNDFFELNWLKNSFASLNILITLLIISVISILNKKEKVDIIFYLALFCLLFIFILWIPLSSFLYILSNSATDYRLFYPYFLFNVMQYIYILILLFLAFVIYKFECYIKSYKHVILFMASLILILLYLNQTIGNTIYKQRHDTSYEAIKNDIYTINEIEKKYATFLLQRSNDIISVPKILVINSMPIMGDEKWLFPVGSGRILPFYEIFPLAFYYFKGEEYFTFENYSEYVCKNFNLEWLKSKNIQYLFIPSDNSGCLYQRENILLNREVLIKNGNSYFVKLYD